jgi:hypothetical protein
MAREMSAKMVEEMVLRLGEINGNIIKIDEAISVATKIDNRNNLTRSVSIVIGVPAGLSAFAFFGLYHDAFMGKGFTFGVIGAVIAFIASKVGLAVKGRELPPLAHKRALLVAQKDKVQGRIQNYAEKNPDFVTPSQATA